MTRLLCMAAIFLLPTPTHALAPITEIKLSADDGGTSDFFGGSVAISETTALVGAFGHDPFGLDRGAAYVFDTKTGAQLFKLTADAPEAGDFFGGAVALSGSTAVIGAVGDNEGGAGDTGAVYVFDTTSGQQLFRLTAEDASSLDGLGSSLAASGNKVVAGARGDDNQGDSSGSAYIFDTTSGQQLLKLMAEDGAAGDLFGSSVGATDTIAIVGSPFDDDQGENSGSVYLFDSSTGEQLKKLVAADGVADDRFGAAVAVSGTRAVVGASRHDTLGTDSGAAYIFDTDTGEQLFKLTANDGGDVDRFGTSVAISGTWAIIGASLSNDPDGRTGAAYVFDITTGEQLLKLTAGDGEVGDQFGSSVALFGEQALVGALFADVNRTNSGAAYTYDLSTIDPVPVPPAAWLMMAGLSLMVARKKPWRQDL